ncbi:MAG TPA: hydantoinase/oxoprolinase family protein, partial [Candidatus Acidoferrum sp.]|nr:hydantoinase/oxoprolinase family protein [Candidatus Acidoferrum sp.]
EIGPRSAHIAGYRYASFSDPALIASARADLDAGIAAVVTSNGTRIAITPTCAANVLGSIPAGAFARGDAIAARLACARVGAALGLEVEALAHAILERASERLRATIDELIADYGLERATSVLVGGGGGAAALVPYAAAKLGFAHRIARDAEVISPLGVALALVRDVVERTIVDPGPAELARIRREAVDAAVASGAAPDRVEVVVEIDTARNRVRATASGATALVEGAHHGGAADEATRLEAARSHLRGPLDRSRPTLRTTGLLVVASAKETAVVDERAVVRLVLPGAVGRRVRAADLPATLPSLIEAHTTFGDVGRALPDVFLLRGARIGEFTGMAEAAQIGGLIEDELAGVDPAEDVVILLVPKPA